MKTINLTLTAEVSADYTPARPTPFCQDHDNPKFSDCGDIGEMESVVIELAGVDIADTIMSYEPQLYDAIVDMLYDKGATE